MQMIGQAAVEQTKVVNKQINKEQRYFLIVLVNNIYKRIRIKNDEILELVHKQKNKKTI